MAKRDKFASIDTHIVLDPWVQTLNANDRGLFLTLLCNPDISMIGIYEISLPTLELYTGLGREAIGHALDRFAKAGKVHYLEGWLIVKNHFKNNRINGNEKLIIGAHKRLSDLPWMIRERLAEPKDTLYIPYLDPQHELYIGDAEGMHDRRTRARSRARAPEPSLEQKLPPTPRSRRGNAASGEDGGDLTNLDWAKGE